MDAFGRAPNKWTGIKFYRSSHSLKNPSVGSLETDAGRVFSASRGSRKPPHNQSGCKANPASHPGLQGLSHPQRQPPALRTPAQQCVTTPHSRTHRASSVERHLKPEPGSQQAHARMRAPPGRWRRGSCRDRPFRSPRQLPWHAVHPL